MLILVLLGGGLAGADPAPPPSAPVHRLGPGWSLVLDAGWTVEEDVGLDGGTLRATRGEESLRIEVSLLPWGAAPPAGVAPTAQVPLCEAMVPARVSPLPGAAHTELVLDRAGMRLHLDHRGPSLPTLRCPPDLDSLDLRVHPCGEGQGACVQRERDRRCEVRCILETGDLARCDQQCTRGPQR